MIGQLHSVVIDCPDPVGLAEFYRELTGLSVESTSDDWVSLSGESGLGLAFQQVSNHQPPAWPNPDRPQQAHLDIKVDNLDTAEAKAIAIGATLLEGSDKPVGCRVYADPAGHPFCLFTA